MIQQLLSKLSQKSEQGSAYDGALSYAAEWHSFVIGIGVGASGDKALQATLVSYALGRGGKNKELSDDAHVKDLADEPAYAIAGLVIGQTGGNYLKQILTLI